MLSNTLMQIKPFSCKSLVARGQPPKVLWGHGWAFLRTCLHLGALQQTLEPQTLGPSAGRGRGPSLALMLALSSSSDGSILPQAGSVLPQAGTLPEVLPQGIWLPPGHLIPEKMRGAGDIAQHRGLVQHA